MQPAEAIELIAGPYQVEERILHREGADPLRVRTYLHAEIADLAKEYLSAIGGYVDLYSRWIGPYPFTEFSVVSSPLPTGFGMPTLTYLGVDVLRLPFIRQTSLGHEILHNWWGNGVYVDFRRGNWSEGLTAFMADYAYREREGQTPGARRGLGCCAISRRCRRARTHRCGSSPRGATERHRSSGTTRRRCCSSRTRT